MNISTEVLNLLADLNLENTAVVKRCYICLTVCNCTKLSKGKSGPSKRPVRLCSRSQPVLPDIDLIDNINLESLLKLAYNNAFVFGGSNNIDMLNNLTPNEYRPQLDNNLNFQTFDESIWSSLDDRTKNHVNIDKEDDIFEDNRIEIFPEPLGPNTTAVNENINELNELDSDVEDIGNEIINETDDIFENNEHRIETFPKPLSPIITVLNENIGEITELDSDVEDIGNEKINETDDLFEDDDIFDDIDDIEARNNETSEPILQKVEDENDVYTESVLKYFRLHTISDIFQETHVDVDYTNEINELIEDNEIVLLNSDDESIDDDENTTIKRKFQEEPNPNCESFRKKLKLNVNCS